MAIKKSELYSSLSASCDELNLLERPAWFRTEHSCCFHLLGLDHRRVFDSRRLRLFGKRYPLYHYSWQDAYGNASLNVASLGRFHPDAMLRTVGDYCEFYYGLSRNLMVRPEAVWRQYMTRVDLPDGLTRTGFADYCQRRNVFKSTNQLYDFPDMIEGVIERGAYPDQMRLLICDEAQDMSPLQWQLVEMWASHAEEFYVAGDHLQSIYGFQGATPEGFLNVRAEVEVLSHSYRLTPEVKQYSQRITQKTNLPYPEFSACDRQGSVFRQSFNSFDWLNLPDAFLLCRTRGLISEARANLMGKLIPFACERGADNPMNTSAGYAFRAMLKLQQDRLLSSEEIQAVAEHTTRPFVEYGMKTHIRKLLPGDYSKQQMRQLGFSEEFFKHLNEPDTVLCRGFDLPERRYLGRLYARYGVDVQPRVTLTTLHGSKGRQKGLVIMNPDLPKVIWNSLPMHRVEETLLQYVGATRARSQLAILVPQGMHTFPLPSIDLARGAHAEA